MRSKQVNRNHYDFAAYVSPGRWASMWHQISEVVETGASSILEVGPGPGIFRAVMSTLGVHVETLDVDPELQPTYVGSVDEIPLPSASFDVTCAFQILEHLPYEMSMKGFAEMVRISRRFILISLPDARRTVTASIKLPRIGVARMSIQEPPMFARQNIFNGEHYWEVNKKGYSLSRVRSDLESVDGVSLKRTYRVHEFPYHRFFVFEKA